MISLVILGQIFRGTSNIVVGKTKNERVSVTRSMNAKLQLPEPIFFLEN